MIHHLHCTHALKNCHLHRDVNVSIIIHCTSRKAGHNTIRPICYLDSQHKQKWKKKRWSWVGGGRRRWENTIAIQVHSQTSKCFLPLHMVHTATVHWEQWWLMVQVKDCNVERPHTISLLVEGTGKPMFLETDRLGNCNNGNNFNHLKKQQSSSRTFKWKEQSPRLHHLIIKNNVLGDTQNL